MESLRDLQLEVWREACRHIQISESIHALTALLGRRMPLSRVLILRIDGTERRLEPVAAGGLPAENLAPSKASLSDVVWKRFVTWGKLGQILHESRGRWSTDCRSWFPDGGQEEVLIGPLDSPEGFAGVVIIAADSGRSFQPHHYDVIQILLEPFSVALENDRRMRELTTLREAAEADRSQLLTQLSKQQHPDEVIVGAETGLRTVMERVGLVAPSDAPVLILGDTGTGKEIVARAIHLRSRRVASPFIRVNCGAIPSELIDSQLFGHERGSFTGAEGLRQGWFERANGGTLFLDEIGELPLPAQVRLLRVLQDGYIERVGGQETIRIDVRVVAATHRDLATMVKQGKFREDLWYRINVFPLLLPRLSERLEDIPALARHFAQRASQRFGLTHVEPTPYDLQLLMQYPWPGNVRELGAVIDRAVILGGGKRMEVAKSLGISRPVPSVVSNEPTFYEVVPEDDYPLGRGASLDPLGTVVTLDEAMKQHIEKALIARRGQIEGPEGAAAQLGINPHTLRARMRKLGVHWAKFRTG